MRMREGVAVASKASREAGPSRAVHPALSSEAEKDLVESPAALEEKEQLPGVKHYGGRI